MVIFYAVSDSVSSEKRSCGAVHIASSWLLQDHINDLRCHSWSQTNMSHKSHKDKVGLGQKCSSSYSLWPHCSGSSLQLYHLPHCDSSSEWQDVLLWVLCQRPGTTAGFSGHQKNPECQKLAQINAQANLGCIIGALCEECVDPRTLLILIILSSLMDRCGHSHKVNFFSNNASFPATGQDNQKVRQKLWQSVEQKLKAEWQDAKFSPSS